MKAFNGLANFILSIHLMFVALFFVYMSMYGFQDFEVSFDLNPFQSDDSLVNGVWNNVVNDSIDLTIKFSQLITIVIIVAVIAIIASIQIVGSGLNDTGSSKLAKVIVYITFITLILAMSSYFISRIPTFGSPFLVFSLFVLWINVFLKLGSDSTE